MSEREEDTAADAAGEAADNETNPEVFHEIGDVGPTLAELDAVRRERDDLQNKLLRTMADYQNFARRSEQNIAGVRDQQALELARGLVGVLDNFELALEVNPEKVSAKDVLHGVQLVRDEFLKALGRFGIERIDVKPGEAFDPNRHEALMRQAAEGIETNHVVTQLQPGYVIKDKTIRPAKVTVAE